MNARVLIAVIDDDESVRESLPDLLREFGYEVAAFASAEAFLASDSLALTQCLILDRVMPGMSGPQLQEELIRRHYEVPIVFITAYADRRRPHPLPLRGAQCLIKPFSDGDLSLAIDAALKDR
ncbi:response regulator [Pseudomonas sp. SZMC_28357]|uniref:response regulator transcription factor n=1 Tax=Pseudomonas sp. SZMC_28357 TaxID=3074380 RepID=UPI0028729CEC|nr:response regulator [Pseudomonas sp. SZMC_28357]MDR9751365.1 response regulator [Pseudomonas sp. SZMC_28357]